MKPATLCFLFKGEGENREVLLAMKKRRFGVGKWNGYGGKIEDSESLYEAACRELKEESGVTAKPSSLIKIGKVDFKVKNKPDLDQLVHLFIVSKWDGEPIETEEMKPCWFKIKDIPYNQMFKADSILVPYILNGKRIDAFFLTDESGENVLDYKIKEY